MEGSASTGSAQASPAPRTLVLAKAVAPNLATAAAASPGPAAGVLATEPQPPAPGADPGPPSPEPSELQPTQAETRRPDFPTLTSGPTPAPAGPAAPSSNGTAPATTIPHVPLGAVAVEVGLRAMTGVNHFAIRLDPEELGGVEVRLEIGGGEVKAHLIVDRVETLSLLQREAKTLERAFEQAGLKSSEGGIDLTLRDHPADRGQGRHEERATRREASLDRPGGQAGRDDASALPPRRAGAPPAPSTCASDLLSE